MILFKNRNNSTQSLQEDTNNVALSCMHEKCYKLLCKIICVYLKRKTELKRKLNSWLLYPNCFPMMAKQLG